MRHCITVFILIVTIAPIALTQDTIQVYEGWNIIGSLDSGISPEELVTSPPGIITAMYLYENGVGYEHALTLDKGTGYWVKVSADGYIIFNPFTPGTASINWVLINSQITPGVDTPAECTAYGWVQVNIFGPTTASASTDCFHSPLVVPNLAAGAYFFDVTLTDPINHPGSLATANVQADIIAGQTADILVTIDCTFCPGQ